MTMVRLEAHTEYWLMKFQTLLFPETTAQTQGLVVRGHKTLVLE